MRINIFRFTETHPVIHEIREIRADQEEKVLTHIVPPLGSPELVFYIGKESQIRNTSARYGVIKGQYTTLQKIDFEPNYHFVSIALHPYGLRQLFGIDAAQLVNAVLDVSEHPLTSDLMELLRSENGLNNRLVAELNKRLQQHSLYLISTVVKTFTEQLEQNLENKVNVLLADSDVNIRTFQRTFKREVGLTPKEYLRIRRMHKIEGALAENLQAIDIVADFDFTDQSHFIRESRQLRGFTPKELVAKKMLLSDQLPAPAVTYL